ncbi:MAG: flagellar basal body P-ring protein FlgI [Limisphaerales bacterium]|jgi:flagellar P-ring protein precursor FlgI
MRHFLGKLLWGLPLLTLLLCDLEAATTRIKDVTQVRGSADYGVSGIGLVVGLAGEGDRSQVYTRQAFSNMLQRNNILVPPEVIQSKNIALVSVQATISSSDRVGSMVDVVVSSLGDAKSLAGGTLTRTLLFGPDQTTAYATVQGPITVGGFNAGNGGAGGASIRQNHPLVGQIVKGARVIQSVPEPEILHPSPLGNYFELELNQPDYVSAAKIADAINQAFPGQASAIDEKTVKVLFPSSPGVGFVDYLARIEPLTFEPDNRAKILINEKTGTVVATEKVTIAPCAISVGGLTISVASNVGVSQAQPLAQGGQTVGMQSTDVGVKETSIGLVALPSLPTIDELAQELNNLGVTTRDMITVFQAMEKVGALNAEIIYQ